MKLPTKSLENTVLSQSTGQRVIKWDVVEVERYQLARLTFLSVNSAWRQGACIFSNLGVAIYGETHKGLKLWQDNSPPAVEFAVTSDDGCLHVYNIWNSGRSSSDESQSYTSGMLIECAGGIRMYRCHDIGTVPDFSKLVFSLELLPVRSH